MVNNLSWKMLVCWYQVPLEKEKKDLATDKKTDLVALSASWYCLLMEWGEMGVL